MNRMLRIGQSGILEWFFQDRVPRLFGNSELNLDKFTSNQLFLAEVPEPEIKQKNMKHAIQLYFASLLISLVVLMYEIYRRRYGSGRTI